MNIKKITLHNFKKYFNRPDYTLDLVNKKGQAKQFIGVLGKNAAGKTTIADAICVAFTKNTYEGKDYKPANLVNNEMTITLDLEVDGTDHTLSRTLKNDGRVYTWKTVLDDKVVPERQVEAELKAWGVNGASDFWLSVHPLALIDETVQKETSKQQIVDKFYHLMQNAISGEIAAIVQKLKTAAFIDVAGQELPLFTDSELTHLTSSPLSVLNYMQNLKGDNKDALKTLSELEKQYGYLQKEIKLLTDDEKKTLTTQTTNWQAELNVEETKMHQYQALTWQKQETERQIKQTTKLISDLEQQKVDVTQTKTYQKQSALATQIVDLAEKLKAKVTKADLAYLQPLIATNKDVVVKTFEAIKTDFNGFLLALDTLFGAKTITENSTQSQIESLKTRVTELTQTLTSIEKQLAAEVYDEAKIKALKEKITNTSGKLQIDQMNRNRLIQAQNEISAEKRRQAELLQNTHKLAYLADIKTEILALMTDFVNKQTKHAEIKLFSEKNGALVSDFQIYGKISGLPYRLLNKAEQWLCGLDLARLFQKVNDAKLPLIIDGAESIDATQRKALILETVKQWPGHQLFVFIVKDQELTII